MKRIKKLTAVLSALVLSLNLWPVSALEAPVQAEKVGTMEEIPFVDVPSSAWYAKAVQYVYQGKLFQGTSPTEFSPEQLLKRAEFVQVLANKTEGYEKGAYEGVTCFADVPLASWACAPIRWGYQVNLVDGMGNSLFSPNDPAARQQIAVLLYRYAQRSGADTDYSEEALNSFPDGGEVSAWALPAVQWAVSKGILKGGDGLLNPRGEATRAEVAQMFMNAASVLTSSSLLPQDERPDPVLPQLLQTIDKDLVLNSLGTVLSPASLQLGELSVVQWNEFCVIWLENAYYANRQGCTDEEKPFPTPVRVEDVLGDNNTPSRPLWEAYFERDCLNVPITLFGGEPVTVLQQLAEYANSEKPGGFSWLAYPETDRLILTMGGRGLDTVVKPVMTQMQIEGDKICLTYQFSITRMGGPHPQIDYQGTAWIVPTDSSFGYQIESFETERIS